MLVERIDGGGGGVAADLHRAAERPRRPGAAAVERDRAADAEHNRLAMRVVGAECERGVARVTPAFSSGSRPRYEEMRGPACSEKRDDGENWWSHPPRTATESLALLASVGSAKWRSWTPPLTVDRALTICDNPARATCMRPVPLSTRLSATKSVRTGDARMRPDAMVEVGRHLPALRLSAIAQDARPQVDLAGRLRAIGPKRHQPEGGRVGRAIVDGRVGVTPRIDHRQVVMVRMLRVKREKARDVQAWGVDGGAQTWTYRQHVSGVALRLCEQVVVVETAHRYRRYGFEM